MVNYEQSWFDEEGSVSLKNNTSKAIHGVTFHLNYLDMEGTPLDYETFDVDVEIAPGKTKRIDVKAFEHDKFYSYFKNDAYYPPPTSLKLNFNC